MSRPTNAVVETDTVSSIVRSWNSSVIMMMGSSDASEFGCEEDKNCLFVSFVTHDSLSFIQDLERNHAFFRVLTPHCTRFIDHTQSRETPGSQGMVRIHAVVGMQGVG